MLRTLPKLIFWYFVLLIALMPFAGVSWEVLSSWNSVSYWAPFLATMVMFAVWAPKRRLILICALLTLAVFRVAGAVAFDWDRVFVLGSIVAAVVVLWEIVRQNWSLFPQLKLTRGALTQKVIKVLILWMPMILAAYLGSLLQNWVERTSIELAYTLTPIDPFCKVGADRLPCESIKAEAPAKLNRLQSPANFKYHLQTLYREKQKALLKRIESDDVATGLANETFTDQKRLEEVVNRLTHAASPSHVLKIAADFRQTDAEILASDVELQSSIRQRDELQPLLGKTHSFPVPPGGEPGSAYEKPLVNQANYQQLLRTIESRTAALLANAQSRRIDPVELKGALALQLRRSLESLHRPIDTSGLVVVDQKQIPGARALLAARVIEKMDREEAAVMQVTEALKIQVDSEIAAGMSPGAKPASAQLEALGIPAYCSTAAQSTTVYTDDTFDVSAEINRGTHLCSDVQQIAQRGSEHLSFDVSVDESILRHRADSEVAVESATRERLVQVVRGTYQTAARANAMSDVVPANINLGRQRCSGLPHHWVNCLTNLLKQKAEDSYKDAHKRALGQYRRALNQFEQEAKRTGAEVVLHERREMYRQIDHAANSLRMIVNYSRESAGVVSVILLALLCLAMIKSFLYILALVVFDFRGPSLVQVDASSPIEGTPPLIGATDSQIEIKDLGNQSLRTKALLDNQAVRTRIAPWPTRALFARLIRGKYFGYNDGGQFREGSLILFAYGNGKHIVDWQLAPGEEVIFSYAHFFGASSNVVLRSHISFKLSTILLGRLVFHSAQAKGGPGHLLLLTNSIARTDDSGAVIESVDPERLVAWHPHAQFRVQNELTLRSVFMDPFTLVRVLDQPMPGRALFESPRRNIRLFSGTFRYLKRLLWPF